MKIIKNSNSLLFVLAALAVVSIAFALSGCGASSSSSSLLKDSLNNMNNKVSSYRFNGAATIDMGDIQGSGTIKYQGSYRAPNELYMKMDLGLMDQSQKLELYINKKGKIYTRPEDTEWLPYMAHPNLSNFQQPGQIQNAVQILKNLSSIIEEVKDAGTENIGGKEAAVMTASANPNKLKALVLRQLTEDSRSSEDEKNLIKSLVKAMTINQDYTIYIDPKTEQILKVKLRQKTKLKIGEQEALITSNMTFNYTDFNKPVEMPDLETGKDS